MSRKTKKESLSRRKGDLDALLDDAQVTRDQLADKLGVSRRTVSNWKELPEYAVAYLELLKKHRVAQHIIGHYMSLLKRFNSIE